MRTLFAVLMAFALFVPMAAQADEVQPGLKKYELGVSGMT